MTLEERRRILERMGGPTWGSPYRVSPTYTGSIVPGRQTITKWPGMMDYDVTNVSMPWLSRGSSHNLVPRQVTSQVSKGVTPRTSRPEAQAYADLQRWRSAQDRLRAMGGTFSRGIGMGEGPQSGNIRTTEGGGWLQHGPPIPDDDEFAHVELTGGAQVAPSTTAVEGPERKGPATRFSKGALSKAQEMISAATGSTDYGSEYKVGGGTRKIQPYQTAPGVNPYASPYLGRREEDER